MTTKVGRLRSAVLRTEPLFGVSARWAAATIAVSLAGCNVVGPSAWKRDEIQASTYADIARQYPEAAAPCRQIVKDAMADGKIDYGELEALNQCDADQSNRANAGAKNALVLRVRGAE